MGYLQANTPLAVSHSQAMLFPRANVTAVSQIRDELVSTAITGVPAGTRKRFPQSPEMSVVGLAMRTAEGNLLTAAELKRIRREVRAALAR